MKIITIVTGLIITMTVIIIIALLVIVIKHCYVINSMNKKTKEHGEDQVVDI